MLCNDYYRIAPITRQTYDSQVNFYNFNSFFFHLHSKCIFFSISCPISPQLSPPSAPCRFTPVTSWLFPENFHVFSFLFPRNCGARCNRMQANLFYSRHEIDEHFHLLTESPHKKRGRMSGGRGEGKERWKRGRGDVLVLYAIFESNDYFEWNIKIPLADVRSELKRSVRRGKEEGVYHCARKIMHFLAL